MKIVREGKEIELTSEELASAHAEFVTNFMRKTLEEDFDVAPEDSQQLAEQAYDRYCEGNGETEYECIEAVYSESGDVRPPARNVSTALVSTVLMKNTVSTSMNI